MLAPGKHYINSPIALTANFQSAAGSDVDPTTVTIRVMDPWGTETSYVYGTDDEVVKDSVGDYTATITPDSAGRWHFRWQTTGTNLVIASEGDFLVQDSPFFDNWPSDY
jgi:hypothetical protein